MAITVVYEDRVASLPADARDGALWVGPVELAATLGWKLEPEGLCRGPACVPVPSGRRAELVRADGAIDLVAIARIRGQAVAHDEEQTAWTFGPSSEVRAGTARTLVAPEFTLPDLAGVPHRLSDARGKKVLLASWASW